MVKHTLKIEESEGLGRLLIGTVQGDIHDIGKNLVSLFAEASGFVVLDLGVDVYPETFVKNIKEFTPDIVALSSLLSVTVPHFKATIDAISRAGLRNSVKIIIGGASASREVVAYDGPVPGVA